MYNLLKKIYSKPRLYGYMSLLSHAAVIVTALSFIPLRWGAFLICWVSCVKVIIITASPLLLVTVLRAYVNAPRPYDLYDFYEHKPRGGTGHSFPSRHAYSVFAIASVSMFIYPVMGAILLALGIIICVTRVLLGIHFIRDVAAGAVTGAVCGVLGVLILSPF